VFGLSLARHRSVLRLLPRTTCSAWKSYHRRLCSASLFMDAFISFGSDHRDVSKDLPQATHIGISRKQRRERTTRTRPRSVPLLRFCYSLDDLPTALDFLLLRNSFSRHITPRLPPIWNINLSLAPHSRPWSFSTTPVLEFQSGRPLFTSSFGGVIGTEEL